MTNKNNNIKSSIHTKSRFHRTLFTITTSAVVTVATTLNVELTTNGAIPENLLLVQTNDDPSSSLELNISDVDNAEESIGTDQQQKQQSPSTTAILPQNIVDGEEKACRVYFAQSTIPGAGWGLFAGVDVRQNEEISILGDALIDLRDLEESSLLDDYTWTGTSIDNAINFGMAAIPNCFFPMTNVYFNEHPAYNKLDYNDKYGTYNPGLGAITVHYSESGGTASYNLKAGSELFLHYGEAYFLDEDRTKNKFGLLPLEKDYDKADKILHRFRNIYNYAEGYAHPCEGSSNDIETNESLDCSKYPYRTSETVEVTDMSNDFYDVTKSVIGLWPTRVQGALPTEVRGINGILDGVGSTAKNYATRSVRSVDYLKENGACMDHLYIDDSAIPFAGKGAFANKFIPEGSFVAPLPLLHLARSVLAMYDNRAEASSGSARHIAHYQLFLNYCFGHRESSMLFCPYGIASSMVNHPGRNQKPNVKLVWDNKVIRDPQWLDMPLAEWKDETHAGLVLNYIATRDIQEDEEILFDYGEEWQQAWEEHIKSYPSSTHFKYYALNSYDPPVELPLYNEKNPLLWALSAADKSFQPHLWCRSVSVVFQKGYTIKKQTADMALYHPCRVLHKKLIDPNTNEYKYTAELTDRSYDYAMDDDYYDDEWLYSCYEWNTGQIVFDLPRDAFLYGRVDLDEYKPIYLEPWTFRHHIGLPDDVLPELWKDLKVQ